MTVYVRAVLVALGLILLQAGPGVALDRPGLSLAGPGIAASDIPPHAAVLASPPQTLTDDGEREPTPGSQPPAALLVGDARVMGQGDGPERAEPTRRRHRPPRIA